MGKSNLIDTRDMNKRSGVEVFVVLLLVLGILVIYLQTRQHDFVVYDDRTYITENPVVLEGLTTKGFRWAFGFTEKDKTYWHPFTWLSHMLDTQLFGANAGSHLMINLLLHIINTLLLLHVFIRMTGKFWPSFIVGALFAFHPLNVESVAWVAARKNLLSTLFWMFTTLVYIRFTEKPGLRRYLLILVIFVLGLLSKPMLVTLPCVLLLLDFWPLHRTRFSGHDPSRKPGIAMGRLVLEKVPMLALSALSVYMSTFSLRHYGDLVGVESVDMKARIANAIVSYVAYLGKMVSPVNLTCYYPFPVEISLGKTAGAFILLIAVTGMAIRWIRRYPFILVGWLWYLGTLFPVIGLMQAGLWPAIADRFTYIPLIGIFTIIAWSGAEICKKAGRARIWLTVTGIILVFTLIPLSHKQVGYWKNSITLFSHAIAVTSNNYLSHYALGYAYERKGMVDEAIRHYNAALDINPNEVDVHYNLAILLASKGDYPNATRHYEEVLRIEPTDAQAHNNLGNLYFRQEKWDRAAGHYRAAIQINPEYVKAHNNLGAAMLRQGNISEAKQHFAEALRIDPRDKVAQRRLQMVQAQFERQTE